MSYRGEPLVSARRDRGSLRNEPLNRLGPRGHQFTPWTLHRSDMEEALAAYSLATVSKNPRTRRRSTRECRATSRTSLLQVRVLRLSRSQRQP